MKIKETFELAFQNHKKNNFKTAEKLYKEILEKQSDHFESIFYLGTLSLQTKNINKAKDWYEKAIQVNPNFPDTYNNLGTIFQNLGDLKKAKACYEKAIQINPDYAAAHTNLGTTLQISGDHEKARACYEKTLKINPNHLSALNNLGNVFHELGKYKEAMDCCEKALKINPNYASALNNLGNALKKLNEPEKAISCYEKAIQINSNFFDAYLNLGKILRDIGKPAEAKKYFKKIDTSGSRSEHLECIYFSDGLNDYEKMLEKLTSQDPLNLRVAALAAYVSKKENVQNIYPFCKDPLNFIFTKNIKNEFTSANEFLRNLFSLLNKINSVWEPDSVTTKGGYQTMSNLFDNKDNEILKLQKIIEKQILSYRQIYKGSGDFFIKKWPIKSKFRGWHVKLLKQGHQKSHIHPAGWLSGVFYLQVPKLLNANEGSIEFTLYGYGYPNHKNLPSLVYKPKAFDIALFPSSLFHRTIPFNSQEERKVIAFDLVPK